MGSLRRIVIMLLICLLPLPAAGQEEIPPKRQEADLHFFLPVLSRAGQNPAPAADAPGLTQLNYLRTLAHLPAVSEEDDWTQGCRDHARYMVKTDTITHAQDPDNEWYTAAGHLAAARSNLLIYTGTHLPTQHVLAEWMRQPFHGVSLIDPGLKAIGYGDYSEEIGRYHLGVCMDLLSGKVAAPEETSYPAVWPAPDSRSPFFSFNGQEWPDPLSSCPGYQTPTGPALFLLLGDGDVIPQVSRSRLESRGVALEHCLFDQTSYMDPSRPAAQSVARMVLAQRSAVVILPREPLTPDTEYRVSVTHAGREIAWRFYTAQQAVHRLP